MPVGLRFVDMAAATRWAIDPEEGGRPVLVCLNALAASTLNEAVMVDYVSKTVRLCAARQAAAEAAEAAAWEASRRWDPKAEGERR